MAQEFAPIGRPVAQRAVRAHGFVSVATAAATTTLAAGALTVAISAPTATIFVFPRTLPAGEQTIAVSAPQAIATLGQRILDAGLQTIAITAPDMGIDNQSTQSLPLPMRRPIGQRGLSRYGPPSLSATPETVLTQTLNADAGVIAVTAPAVTRTATITLQAGAETIAVSAPDASVVVLSAGVSANPIILRQRQLIRARYAPKRPLISTFGVVDALAPATLTASADASGIAVTAPTAVRVAGSVSLSAGAQTIAVSAPPVAIVGGGDYNLSAGAQNIALSAPDMGITVGTATVPMSACVVAVIAPDMVANRTVTAEPAVVAVVAPPVTVFQGLIRQLSDVSIAVSAPDVTVVVQSAARDAGDVSVAVSAPDVVTQAVAHLGAGAVGISVSAPDATLVVGTTTLVLQPAVIALKANSPSVLGATVLPPDVFEGTVESRLTEHTIESGVVRTLEFRA